MREILFRGKNNKGEWEYGVPLISESKEIAYMTQMHSYNTRVAPDTIGQYTGLTDKNGTKIFEGDIVKACWNTIFKVFFDEQILQYRAKAHHEPHREISYYGYGYQMEIIGNIYDNPELWEE